MKTGIIYGSTTGNTERIAKRLQSYFPDAEIKSVVDVGRADFEAYDLLLLGASTWGLGEIQEDWISALPELEQAELKGKYAAVFGLGDQEGYPGTFVDAIRHLHDAAQSAGACMVGYVSEDGYYCSDSEALEDGHFLGLPLDEDNEENLTDMRLEAWSEQVLQEVNRAS